MSLTRTPAGLRAGRLGMKRPASVTAAPGRGGAGRRRPRSASSRGGWDLRRRPVALALLLPLTAGLAGCLPGSSGPGGAPRLPDRALARHAEVFGRWESYPGPRFAGVDRRSLYVPMADGTRLAVDVFLPADLPAGERLPTVLVVTRYWRGREGEPPGLPSRFFTAHGYAVAVADERGTGASFGSWSHPWSPAAIADYGALAAWCARQPWSDGRVASLGTSYVGTTAQLLALPGNPAVAAVVPKFIEVDVFTDIVAPGGVPLAGFLELWSAYVRELDAGRSPEGGPGVRRVDEDRDGALLAAALAEHAAAPDLLAEIAGVGFRDQPVGAAGIIVDDFSVHTFERDIEASGVPIYGWGSWMDAATADAVLRRFLTFTNPQRAVIGPWSHGGGHHADPFLPADRPVDPPPPTQLFESFRFIEHHLRGADTGLPEGNVLVYYTLGAGSWRATATWPPAGVATEQWFLGEGGVLAPEAASSGAESGATDPAMGDRRAATPPKVGSPADGPGRAVPTAAVSPPAGDGTLAGAGPSTSTVDYRVDLTATTGRQNRWFTEADGDDVVYPDRRREDEKLLVWDSAPLAADLEITGHPAVSLRLASTHPDGAVFVYLEAVAPDGRVVMITEGQLRLLHRTLRSDLPAALGPRPTFRRADARQLVPGEPATLRFTLLPTSVVIPAGWRLRLALAGHDEGTFARLPAGEEEGAAEGGAVPVLTVEQGARGTAGPSFLELPVRR